MGGGASKTKKRKGAVAGAAGRRSAGIVTPRYSAGRSRRCSERLAHSLPPTNAPDSKVSIQPVKSFRGCLKVGGGSEIRRLQNRSGIIALGAWWPDGHLPEKVLCSCSSRSLFCYSSRCGGWVRGGGPGFVQKLRRGERYRVRWVRREGVQESLLLRFQKSALLWCFFKV